MTKVLFIGDSITDRGEYPSLIDTYFASNPCLGIYHFDNIGLCSENVSGLTEDGHPGARPNIHERLDRIIDYYNADIAVILYGINDAIYKRFDKARFEIFKQGMIRLIARLRKSDLKIYLCTPTAFDPLCSATPLTDPGAEEDASGKLYRDYNEVMTTYAEWMRTALSESVDKIIDVNASMNSYIDAEHAFDISAKTGDGIHPNFPATAKLAETILKDGFDIECDMLKLISDKSFMAKYHLIFKRDMMIHRYDKAAIGHKGWFIEKALPKEKVDSNIVKINKKLSKLCGLGIANYQYKDFKQYKHVKSLFQGLACTIVIPNTPNAKRDWIWRTEFFGAFTDADKLALSRGYHLVYINIIDSYGSDNAVFTMKEFYDYIVKKYSLNTKFMFLGLSRGGLMAVNFAYKYTSHVNSLFLDAPVVDLRSWPMGKFKGVGSAADTIKLKLAYNDDFSDLDAYALDLHDKLQNLAQHKLPIAVYSNEMDDVVPYLENGCLIKNAYKDIAKDYFMEILKPLKGHHPHGGARTAELFEFLESRTNK